MNLKTIEDNIVIRRVAIPYEAYLYLMKVIEQDPVLPNQAGYVEMDYETEFQPLLEFAYEKEDQERVLREETRAWKEANNQY